MAPGSWRKVDRWVPHSHLTVALAERIEVDTVGIRTARLVAASNPQMSWKGDHSQVMCLLDSCKRMAVSVTAVVLETSANAVAAAPGRRRLETALAEHMSVVAVSLDIVDSRSSRRWKCRSYVAPAVAPFHKIVWERMAARVSDAIDVPMRMAAPG